MPFAPCALPDPWSDLLPEASSIHPFVLDSMLRLIAYDIADPRRLRRVAAVCQDFGIRVQKSLFECWLEEPRFDELWEKLCQQINSQEDTLSAYVIDRACSPRRRQFGAGVPPTLPRERFIL